MSTIKLFPLLFNLVSLNYDFMCYHLISQLKSEWQKTNRNLIEAQIFTSGFKMSYGIDNIIISLSIHCFYFSFFKIILLYCYNYKYEMLIWILGERPCMFCIQRRINQHHHDHLSHHCKSNRMITTPTTFWQWPAVLNNNASIFHGTSFLSSLHKWREKPNTF